MNLRERLHRFRAWQREPFIWSDSDLGEHRCVNCGRTFTGRYCPICGQNEADGARISWTSVRRDIMKIWGLDSRSMPSSLWQLFMRPGYFIGDYLNGRRQVSYPPTKLLFVVAVLYVLLMHIFVMLNIFNPRQETEHQEFVFMAISWLKDNPGWGTLSLTLMMILPTFVFFRFSPLHTRHSLPEGVFVQLFMSTLMLVVDFFVRLSFGTLVWLIPFYYYITYRQLFGYRFWGTAWRLVLCFVVWTFSLLLVILFVLFVSPTVDNDIFSQPLTLPYKVLALLAQTGVIAVILLAGYLLSRRTHTRKNSLHLNNKPK